MGLTLPPALQTYLAPPPPLPDAGLYLWQWFCELHGRRSSGLGVNPISWTDLQAWATLRRLSLQQWELSLLCALDGAWLEAYGKPRHAHTD